MGSYLANTSYSATTSGWRAQRETLIAKLKRLFIRTPNLAKTSQQTRTPEEAKSLCLSAAQHTDVGRRRPHNEDNMAYIIPRDAEVMAQKGALFLVADGMGGHAAGEVASELAVNTVCNTYYQMDQQEDHENVARSLEYAIKSANSFIHQQATKDVMHSGMGTTCVAAVVCGTTATIANVGDSRAYLVRNGQVRQITYDHSWVAEQVRAGILTEQQAERHALRNIITRALGHYADVQVDLFTEQLMAGDSLVLCSDGLSGAVSQDEILGIIERSTPQESVHQLVECALEHDSMDNITAIVVRVSS